MIQLDYKDSGPLYEQIKEKIKLLIISGALKFNDQIPSVRELAQTLTINPNTIQRAYKDLEMEGFIFSIQGKGNFVAPLESTGNTIRQGKLLKELGKIVSELAYMGLSKEQIMAFIEDILAKKGANNDD